MFDLFFEFVAPSSWLNNAEDKEALEQAVRDDLASSFSLGVRPENDPSAQARELPGFDVDINGTSIVAVPPPNPERPTDVSLLVTLDLKASPGETTMTELAAAFRRRFESSAGGAWRAK